MPWGSHPRGEGGEEDASRVSPPAGEWQERVLPRCLVPGAPEHEPLASLLHRALPAAGAINLC